MHDLVIREGTLVDGTGAPRRVASVAIDGGRITAVGLTKTMFKSGDGLVPIAQFIAASGQAPVPPPLPEVIARLQEVEGLIRERQAEPA